VSHFSARAETLPKKPVSLAQIKATKSLAGMVLVKNSRLSVQPVQQDEFDIVIRLAAEK